MHYGKYHFNCSFERNAILPPYKGSTFRGVFGTALKKVVCALKQAECPDCLLNERCVYAQVFETQAVSDQDQKKRIAIRPHPYVIEPPLSAKTQFFKDDPFHFHLLLFGEANRNLPYFIYAFEQMGHIGIGRKVNGTRGRFCLNEVRSGTTTLYSARDGKLHSRLSGRQLALQSPPSLGRARLKLDLITPLRVKYKNRLKAELPFHVFVRAMLRRLSSLFSCYGNGEPALDYRGMVKRAQTIKVMESRLTWYDWRRFSFRQDQSMLMGGMLGSVIYEGPISEFMPLVEICSEVHIGKQTAFGLGKIKAEVV